MGLEAIAKGIVGEMETRFILSLFPKPKYRVINNVLIPTENGTTQVDHVVVSPGGVFAVETKHKNGWIYGNEYDKEWTQVEFNKKYRFQNPLHQNYAHTKSLAQHLGIDHDKIHSVVVFWGSCELKTRMPDNVCKGGILSTELQRYIASKKQLLLTPEEVDSIHAMLQDAKKDSGILNQIRHVAEVKRTHESSTKCPKCGGELVKRVSTRGDRRGETFLGCSNYPRCRYIKEL